MATFLVWETEYPDEGSCEVEAHTEKGAMRRYRRATMGRGTPDDTPLSVCVATPDILRKRREAENLETLEILTDIARDGGQ